MDSIQHIAIVDCSASGHRQMYYQQYARMLTDKVYDVRLFVPQADRGMEFQPVRTRPLLPLPTGQPLKKKFILLRNAFLLLQNLAAIRSQLRSQEDGWKPDLVFFPCLDDILPTLTPLWLLDILLPYRWSGLFIQAIRKGGMLDLRRCFRSQKCIGVGVLNELVTVEMRAYHPHIVEFPDIADISVPDTTYPLLHKIQEEAKGRKIVSLLGSINTRKGTELLQEVIRILPASDYYFVIAGKSSLTPEQEVNLHKFQVEHSNCMLSLERIPDEACFNALVAASNLVFAVYRQFTGSSNLLTKAAAFGKPVVVAKGYCMGKRVEFYGTGIAVGETDVQACTHAIARLCNDTPLLGDDSPLNKTALMCYADDHNLYQLFNSFFHLLIYRP